MSALRSTQCLLSCLALIAVWGCNNAAPPSTAGSAIGAETESDPKEEKTQAKPPAKQHAKGRENRLARETSPYLLLHAHNPVDWYPWGPEAFEKAKKEKKLIFLSIGYSSCFWCHVMEREVFSDDEIAKFMNKNFVNIKVDREERPDLDDIYMTGLHIYLQLSGSNQGGGWPLSIFLTPEGKPIAGGTYFPPEDKQGMPGFPSVMNRIQSLWTKERESVVKTADTITDHLRRTMKPRLSLTPVDVDRKLVKTAAGELLDSFDAVYGGVDFSERSPNRPKFPVPAKLALLQYQVRVGDEDAKKVITLTLDKIAAGGIRDHLAGGFHRYSTDRAWMVPHFEKMLYDNAQLLDVYTEAYRQTKNPVYREVVEELAAYVFNEMTGDEGAFFSAQDAETDAIEGKFYVWEPEEIEKILGADVELFQSVFGFKEQQYFEHGFIVHLPKPIAVIAKEKGVSAAELSRQLKPLKQKVLSQRKKRKTPLLDDKILTSWNGLMIRGLANAGSVLEHPEYITAAEKAAAFILENMRDDKGRLLRTFRAETAKLNAYLDDYAFLTEGVLALHQATGKDQWLSTAKKLTDDQIKLFWDETGDGFFYTSHHHEELLARTKNAYDSVLPSGNSVSVRNLLRLAERTGDAEYRKRAESILKLFAPAMKTNPRSMINMALATAEFLDSEAKPQQPDPDDGGASANIPSETSTVVTAGGTANGTSTTKKKTVELVAAKVYLSSDKLTPANRTRLAVVLNVKPGWHINQNPSHPDYLIPTSVKIKAKLGTKLTNVRYPQGHDFKVQGIEDELKVYEDAVRIYGELEVPASAVSKKETLDIEVRYQACSDKQCMRPKTIKLRGEIQVVAEGEKIRSINSKQFEKLSAKPKASSTK
ncbi:MAG: thioredoxin [Planctomycetaceae bacterium]|nr:thioredoxin [Planctomycetaceae bacterium]